MSIQLTMTELPNIQPLRAPRMVPDMIGLTGLREQARVATPNGWRAVGDLSVGDKVETLDGGTEQIARIEPFWIDQETHVSRPNTWPLFFPAGAVGNSNEVVVSARQTMVMQSSAFAETCGAPRALLQAGDFFGLLGVHRIIPDASLSLRVLRFANPVVLVGKEGLMYRCGAVSEADDVMLKTSGATKYPRLTGRAVERFIVKSEPEFAAFDRHAALSNGFAYADEMFEAAQSVIGF